MKDFRKKPLTEQIADRMGGPVRARTDYRCAAHGCPNAGVIDDRGEDNRGRCFHHANASAQDWDRVTRQIRADESMRNHGIVPVKPSPYVLWVREQMRGPRGLRSGVGNDERTHYGETEAA